MKREKLNLRGGVSMWINLLLLLAMVGTNLLSFHHLSKTHSTPPHPVSTPIPSHLLTQLSTIRSTISNLKDFPKYSSKDFSKDFPKDSPELLLSSSLSPLATACHHHPDLLLRYMNYTPFHLCPSFPNLPETLIHLGCHPLPRRRCFSSPPKPLLSPLPPLPPPNSNLDLSIHNLLSLCRSSGSVIRLGLDVGGGTGALAASIPNATILTTTLDLGGARNGAAAAARGVVPLNVPLQQRFPVHDGTMDLVRCGRAVNRWIPTPALEFLIYDVDRVLKSGGLLWLDHFFCNKNALEEVYAPMIRKLGYKVLKWTTGSKLDGSGVKNREVYLTALLQKHGS